MLFIFGGLPGVGKSTLAAYLSQEWAATYLRIDTIEHALREWGTAVTGPEGYLVAYAVAQDNLRRGGIVVADSVNPIEFTRRAWRDAAASVNVDYCQIEVVCSDLAEHRRRVEGRQPPHPGFRLPTWQQVVDREYAPWPDAQVVLDTAGHSVVESQQALMQALAQRGIREP